MDTTPVHLIEVTPRELPGLQDTRGESIRSMLSADHNLKIGSVRSITGYQVKAARTGHYDRVQTRCDRQRCSGRT